MAGQPDAWTKEWLDLGEGYPGEGELARAAFDVLAPYTTYDHWASDEHFVGTIPPPRRSPGYELCEQDPIVEEVWELATKIGDKIKQAMFDAARDHKHAEFEDFDKPTLLQVIRQLQDRVLFFERELQVCNTSDRLKLQEINTLRRKLDAS